MGSESVCERQTARQISYRNLLAPLLGMHDPTTPNRQGWDFGDRYRSYRRHRGGVTIEPLHEHLAAMHE